MADKNQRRAACVPGPWYVDDTCIACASCAEAAPDCFGLEADGMAFVKAQPSGANQEAACQEALETCPVDAIGSDG